MDGVPLTKLGVGQMDKPAAESVVAVEVVAITPEGAADNAEGAAQILIFPRLSKPTRQEADCERWRR